MADVGAFHGVPLVEAGAAVEGARVLLASSAPGTRSVTRDDCVRLIGELADIRDARVLDGSFHDQTEVSGSIPQKTLEMYASDARLRGAYAAWATRGSELRDKSFSTTKNLTLDDRFAWERSVAEADARRRVTPSCSSSFTSDLGPKRKENRDPALDGSNAFAPRVEVCSRGHDEGDPREGYVRFRVDPVASGGADWPDEAQLLGRRVDSGLDRTRRARVPDARRVAFGTAHASRAAAARATARARERGDALGLPSLGTAGADEGRWEAIHGDASAKRGRRRWRVVVFPRSACPSSRSRRSSSRRASPGTDANETTEAREEARLVVRSRRRRRRRRSRRRARATFAFAS
jgi:hypothetical protein